MNLSFVLLARCIPRTWKKIVVRIGVVMTLAASQVPAEAASLSSLFQGGFIDAGGSRFSNWELLTLDATAATSPILSQITVNPLTNDPTQPGLSYIANGQLATQGINAIDLTFRYRVQVLPGGKAYLGQSLDLTGLTIGAGTGLTYISQEIADLTGNDLGSSLVMADNGANYFQFSDDATFAQRFSLIVATNVFLTGLSGADTVSVSTFTQHFTQTGTQILPGDYNANGSVDAADYVVWRKTDGSQAGYNLWRTHFGKTAAGSAAHVTASVPEPSVFVIAIAGILGIFCPRQQR